MTDVLACRRTGLDTPLDTVAGSIFWVYTLPMTASTAIRDIHCVKNGQEFCPARPTGALCAPVGRGLRITRTAG
ncbi:hypothetical protein Q9L58_004659 [Maublancomyces gigas]|uniref:Uncharacterized protein n=1 Tax=Discina gigas TaxID=1032678 RepID=A0ABR3GKE9_9PEZI